MTVARRRQQPPAAVRRTRKRPPLRRGMRVLGAVSLGILTASGIGHAVLGQADDRLTRVDAFAGMKNRPTPTKGTNFLLVGTDVRRGLTQTQRTGLRLGGEPCDCTDAMMLAHLSRDGRRVSVVALPQDSYAELPRAAKLKWAWGVGGPALAVATVEKMTGIKVDHYAEFDFRSFMKTVDGIGGVDLCFAQPVRDLVTGLDLPAGTVRADGGTALRYVRSGHLPNGLDLPRMQNQQRFLAALVRRVTDIGLLQNPVKLDQVAKAALGSVRADRQTKPDDLIALATGLRGGFGDRSVEFATVPVDATPFRVQGVGTTLRWDVKGAKRIFDALREDRPLTGPDGGPMATPSPSASPEPEQVDVPPKSIRVQVNNGTTVNGLGARVDKELHRLGFRTTGTPGNTVRHDARYTVIHYDPGWDRSAKALGTALPYAELRSVPGLGSTLRVTVGADYDGVTPVRAGKPDPPAAPPVALPPMRGDRVVCG
ncbi:LCP family protein [Streptomyces sp. ME01-24h]|nr:LCP family protein [Streptomyces sp. ME19-03-3]MDX3357854.1 LCP family protein [Streptomyces sp. ME01-24h]